MSSEREQWINLVDQIARPVLSSISEERLRKIMPIEASPGHIESRKAFTHLEAVGRLLAGVSPWLARGENQDLAAMAQRALAIGTDPSSPDFFNFNCTESWQPLVDAAFLAQAILRAPELLWRQLNTKIRGNIVAAMKSVRVVKPPFNNWLLFAAMIEAFLAMAGEDWDAMRVDCAIRQHLQWYKGDGVYGDGPDFHWDYYNSFVIHPMLLDILDAASTHRQDWDDLRPIALKRAQRYGAVLERLIAPDGSFPVIGRSMAYRSGAFQTLAQLALQKNLPSELPPAQVRAALSAVIARTLGAPDTFDAGGWLRIGLCGHQPDLAESYIATGSLYLCATAFLPLGLPETDEFWSSQSLPFTGQKAWSGQNLPTDHAIEH
jgi:hypothetical protein